MNSRPLSLRRRAARWLMAGAVLALILLPLASARATLYFNNARSGASFQVSPAGVVSQFPGSGAIGTGYPIPIAVDRLGNLFQFPVGGNRIEKITPAGVKTTFVTGVNFSASAEFDAFGNLFVMDLFGVIKKVTPSGVTTTLPTTGSSALASDSLGNLFTVANGNLIKIAPDGTVSVVTTGMSLTNGFSGLAVDSTGSIFATDNATRSIIKVAPDGSKSTIDTGLTGSINDGLAVDALDNLFVGDARSGNILRYTPSGVRSTFANTSALLQSLTFGAPVLIPEPSTLTFGAGLTLLTVCRRRRAAETPSRGAARGR